MPKCRFCDGNAPLTANFCPKCGASIDGLSPQAVEDLEQQVRSLLTQRQMRRRELSDRTCTCLDVW